MNSENIVLAGFWVGSKPEKTTMKTLFTSILDNLNDLSSGLRIRTSSGIVNIFFKLIMGIFDLPAKAAVLNAKQYIGKYGCSVCVHPGVLLSNNIRIFPPLHYRERTRTDVMSNAAKAERDEVAVKCIMGTSSLTSNVDLVDGIPVDYMHCFTRGIKITYDKMV